MLDTRETPWRRQQHSRGSAPVNFTRTRQSDLSLLTFRCAGVNQNVATTCFFVAIDKSNRIGAVHEYRVEGVT